MAIIESNNNQYLAVGIIKLCGLEAVEAVFGVDERNKIVRKLCQRIAEKYAQCCDIVTFNADLYLLLCRENVQTFTRKIAMVNDLTAALATAICASISLPFVNLCRGKTPGVTQKN